MTAIRYCSLWAVAAFAKWTAKTDIALCSLQSFWNPLRTLRALGHRPALRARREPGLREHPHVRPRRRLRRGDVPAMLRTRRSQAFTPMSSHSGAVFPPNAAAGADARIVVGRYLEDVCCDGNVHRWFLRSCCCVLIARCSPDTSRASRSGARGWLGRHRLSSGSVSERSDERTRGCAPALAFRLDPELICP
jgi:hypothetical protein